MIAAHQSPTSVSLGHHLHAQFSIRILTSSSVAQRENQPERKRSAGLICYANSFYYMFCKVLINLAMSWDRLFLACFRILIKIVAASMPHKHAPYRQYSLQQFFSFHTFMASSLISCCSGTSSSVISA